MLGQRYLYEHICVIYGCQTFSTNFFFSLLYIFTFTSNILHIYFNTAWLIAAEGSTQPQLLISCQLRNLSLMSREQRKDGVQKNSLKNQNILAKEKQNLTLPMLYLKQDNVIWSNGHAFLFMDFYVFYGLQQ